MIVNGYSGVYDTFYHGALGTCTGVGGENPGVLTLGTSYMDVPGGTVYWNFTGNGNYNDQSGSVLVEITPAEATCEVQDIRACMTRLRMAHRVLVQRYRW